MSPTASVTAVPVSLVQLTLVALLTALPALHAYKLQLTNDGPAVVGTPITFTATYPSFFDTFVYEFRDKNNRSVGQEVTASSSAKFTVVYDKVPEYQELVMTVTVWQQWLGQKLLRLDEAQNKFKMSINLIGRFELYQEKTPEAAVRQNILATESAANISVLLHDPSGFFDSFAKTYTWSVNGTAHYNSAADNSSVLQVALPQAGVYDVSCFVLAMSLEKKIDRSVNLTTRITAKDPIRKLKFEGKFFLPRNAELDLTITCETGSGPFSFCKEIKNVSEIESDNCTEVLISGRKVCSFHVPWYFREAGKYNLWVRVTNEVSTVFQNVEISVMDFKIQPSLTFVVIPVASSVLAIFIIVFGIALHVQQRRRGFTVEVADFDFSARDDSDLLIKTFFQRLKESLVTSIKGTFFASPAADGGRSSRNRRFSADSSFGEDRDDGYASRSIHR